MSTASVDKGRRNRNVVFSNLMMKKASCKEFSQQVLVARYGLPAGDQEEAPESAELWVFKGTHNPAKTSSNPPKFTIPLQGSTLVEQILLPGDGDSEAIASDSNSGIGSGGDGGNNVRLLSVHSSSLLFGLTTADGTSYHFRACDEREYKTWINLLKFLEVFPYSTLPMTPSYDPAGPHCNFNPILYSADSVWLVYILPDEIGLRCSIQGPRILTLQNQKPGRSMSKLEIYSETDHLVPVFSCRHNDIRRTGKIGMFLYVEVGRRCKFGPGLLWMYFGNDNEKASYMRDIMCEFLLQQQSSKTHCSSRLRRTTTAPVLISTLVNPQPNGSCSPRLHHTSLPPTPIPRQAHYNSHLTRATNKQRSASATNCSAPESIVQDRTRNFHHILDPPKKPTGQDQNCNILEPPKQPPSDPKPNHYHTLEQNVPNQNPNYYQVLEQQEEHNSEPHNHYHVLESPKAQEMVPNPHQYHVLDVSTELDSENPNHNQYHVLEPDKEPHLYHILEPNDATVNSSEMHQYDTVDLKKMRRHSEKNHCHQYHTLGTTAAPNVVPVYHTIGNKE